MGRNKEQVAVVALAAGHGRRMNSPEPKQFTLLSSKPLFLHSLEFFLAMTEIDEVCLVLPPDATSGPYADAAMELAAKHKKRLSIASGGARRQDSTLSGLRAIQSNPEIVLVHDCARPFPPLVPVLESIEEAKLYGGAILAMPVVDTVKRVEPGTREIVQTLNRENLFLAQTPQTFQYHALLEALEKLERQGMEITDEAMAFEFFGREVRIVLSDAENLKVTLPEDLIRAESIAKKSERA